MSKQSKDINEQETEPTVEEVKTEVLSDEATPSANNEELLFEDDIEQLKALAAQADEFKDKYLRSVAELENYRKRVTREKAELVRYTTERVVSSLLSVLDNLDRAVAAAEQSADANTAILEGVQQIQTQFRRSLEDLGLKEIVTDTGHTFDPNLHEAVSHVESKEHPEGVVISQLQRGYHLSERLLRPARVVVSKGSAKSDGDADDNSQDESEAEEE